MERPLAFPVETRPVTFNQLSKPTLPQLLQRRKSLDLTELFKNLDSFLDFV